MSRTDDLLSRGQAIMARLTGARPASEAEAEAGGKDGQRAAPPSEPGGWGPVDDGTPPVVRRGDGHRRAVPPPSEQETWPDPRPLPDPRPPVAPCDPDLLPEALRPWIVDIAERVGCPMDFPAAGAMVALASTVGRRCGIRPKRHDDWTVIPNLWGAVVGRPGALKSPALAEATRPLVRLAAAALTEGEAAMRDWQAGAEARKAETASLRGQLQAALAGKGERREDEIRAALAALAEKSRPPECVRYMTSDATIEKLGEILKQNPNGLLVMRDELTGWLRGLDKQGHETDRGFFLQAWNGDGPYTWDRIGRGTIQIPAVCVSILGSIQPGPLSIYVTEAIAGQGADGLLQRFQLVAFPNDPAEWHSVDRWPDSQARNTAYATYAHLVGLRAADIGAVVDPAEPDGVPYLHLSDEAQEICDGWRERLEHRLLSGDGGVEEAHLSKYRSLVPSLALLCHLADGETGPVGAVSLARAEAWAEYLESHARRIYSSVLRPGLPPAHALGRRLRAGDVASPFGARDVYRCGWSGLDREAVEAALPMLEAHDWIRGQDHQTGGRPTRAYRVNPRLEVAI